ncbi:beta-1,3-N-acetylglucosaminyltransferase radical fringe-like [Dysidea avara]|uniref:beta-1,3-N-acetylglucosaminyltransferase radical fringe-like n=1 Tax=Dysidea avara TaxID=196820 RepID=UPI00332A4FDD
MFDRYLRTIQLCMTGMVCVVVAVLLTYDWSPESSSVFVHSDILVVEHTTINNFGSFSDDKLDHNQEEPDHTNLTPQEVKPTSTNQNQNVNKKKAPNLPDHTSPTSQTDGKVAESTSTNEKETSPEVTSIKISGKPLEKVNANYTHNIYFSVKSSGKNYKDRLFPSMLTWFQLLDKDELTITSDNASAGKPYLDRIKKAGFNVVISSCPGDHSYKALCCKTGMEFSSYYKALEKHNGNKDRYQWYCHVDDDIYVNVPQLSHVLQQYDPSKPYYIGRYPWILRRRYDKHPYLPVNEKAKNRIHKRNLTVMADIFQYATGATYCASRALIMKGEHLLNGKDNFIASCELAGNFDDITVGFIFGAVLGCNLTEVDSIYNQFYKLGNFSKEQISKFLTVSYIMNAKTHKVTNAVPLKSNIPGDITRFMAYHCLLYPSVSWCPR